MKIITKQELYKLPNGTLYSNYEPCIFTGINIKCDTYFLNGEGNDPFDFSLISLIGNLECNGSDHEIEILCDALENKKSFKLDFNSSERDALYDEEDLYAVYEKHDVVELINKLQLCVQSM